MYYLICVRILQIIVCVCQTFKSVAAAPPSNNTGDSAIWAFLTAVTVFVRPEQETTTTTTTIKMHHID